MKLNNFDALRSSTMTVVLFEVPAAGVGAGTTTTFNLLNAVNLVTGVKENKSVSVTVGGSAITSNALCDLWVTAFNNAISSCGGAAFKGSAGTTMSFVIMYPYSDATPFTGLLLATNGGHITSMTSQTIGNQLLNQDIAVADLDYIAKLQSIEDLEDLLAAANHEKDLLELQLASAGGGSSGAPGSTTVSVAGSKVSEVLMAAIAGFGVGHMVASDTRASKKESKRLGERS